jgi:hypothetical protein
VEIDLPFWTFKRLKKLHLLERTALTLPRKGFLSPVLNNA